MRRAITGHPSSPPGSSLVTPRWRRGRERGSEHSSHGAAGPPAPSRLPGPSWAVGDAYRPLAGAGGTGRDVRLLVSRRGEIAEEKAEPRDNQVGTVSFLPREPWAAVGRSALEGSSPSTGKAHLPGECPSLPPTPRHAGLDSPG